MKLEDIKDYWDNIDPDDERLPITDNNAKQIGTSTAGGLSRNQSFRKKKGPIHDSTPYMINSDNPFGSMLPVKTSS